MRKTIAFLFIAGCITITLGSPVKDLILGRTYVVPEETFEQTFSLLKMTDEGISVQQILYAIFTPIQVIVSNILALICYFIAPITALVETARSAILENLIATLALIIPLISTLAPEVGVALEVVQLGLEAGNQLLYNGTIIIQDYGCSTIQTINDVISSIVNAIIGVF